MNWLEMIIIVVVLTVVSQLVFAGVKKYILPKYKIKKWYLLVAIFLLFVIPIFFPKQYNNIFILTPQILLVSVLFMTMMEIRRIETINKNKPVVGRPLQKPNRVKTDKK